MIRKGGGNMAEFKDRLKLLRTERDISMRDLEKRLVDRGTPISRGMLSRYENGTSEPNIKQCKWLAECFDVNVDYLIGLTDNPISSTLLDHVVIEIEHPPNNTAIIQEYAKRLLQLESTVNKMLEEGSNEKE
jgi:transcriptional regulator with XRE-family HTH domain